MALGKGNPDIIHNNGHGTIPASYWMRVLEERYQRLHAKVINGNARFATNRNLNYTGKRPPARYLKQYKQTSNRQHVHALAMANEQESKQSNTLEKATYERFNQTECSIISSSELHTNATSNRRFKSLLTLKPKDSCAGDNHGLADTTQVHQESIPRDLQLSKNGGLQNSGDLTGEPPTAPKNDLVEDCFTVNSSSQCSLDVSLGESDHMLIHPDSGKHKENSDKNDKVKDDINTGVDTDSSGCKSGKLKYYKEMKHMEDKRNSRRRSIQKRKDTWVCSTIKKSSTGLPENRVHSENCIKSKHIRHAINSRSRRTVDSIDIHGAMQQRKSRGMNERLFARMSVEAQRAVDETLKDMNGNTCRVDAMLQDEHRDNRNGTPVHKHSGHARVESNNRQPTNRITDKTEDPATPQDKAERVCAGSMLPRSKIAQEDIPNCTRVQYSTNFSNQKKASMQNHFVTNQEQTAVKVTQADEEPNHKLPLLEHKIAQTTHIMASNRVNLPGIWNRRDALSFREKTFEITPLNFDIRFHQIIPHNREDRETPSPDTQQQAIEKCHQWLVRYMSIN
ncbi:hypothetical protein BsWGS_01930 [Bradybaena similaris]